MFTPSRPDWLGALAVSRQAQAAGSDQPPRTTLQRDRDGGAALRVTLLCGQPPAASSSALADMLLAAFAEATTRGARARAQGPGLLPRGVEVTAAPAAAKPDPAAAGSSGDEQGQQQQEPQAEPLVVHFTATEPAAEEQVEEAARLFEAFWQYHVKASKSDLHCRMRQRLGGLRQQLALAKLVVRD